MNIIDLVRSSLFVLAQWFGGSFGTAIVAASVVLRVAMLPITLPAARRRLVREQRMRAMAPALEQLERRHAGQPERLFRATEELYAANGLSMFDRRVLLDSLLQFPPAALLYSAIGRAAGQAGGFLWISNLVTPDRALATVAGVIGAASAWFAARSPEASQISRLLPLAVTGVITYFFLAHISAGVALYSITNSVVAAVEQAVARRSLDRARA
ncbi:MAG TPA: YidC/Oxa1 family membrane protein insertase [Gemmatimonadaceae bacterium]